MPCDVNREACTWTIAPLERGHWAILYLLLESQPDLGPFIRAFLTKYHGLGGFNDKSLFSHGFGV